MSSPTTPEGPATTVAAAVDRLCTDDWRDLHPYRKWAGAHWRLLALVDLGAADDPRLDPLLEHDLAWLTSSRHRARIRSVTGRVRQCASQEGAAVLVAAASGRADLHWPPYWHYDLLQGARCLAALGRFAEVPEAAARLDEHRSSDGRWQVSGRRWWRRPGSTGSGVDVVDWSMLADDVVSVQVQACRQLGGVT